MNGGKSIKKTLKLFQFQILEHMAKIQNKETNIMPEHTYWVFWLLYVCGHARTCVYVAIYFQNLPDCFMNSLR